MKTFVHLLLSGGLWLVLIKLAQHFELAPAPIISGLRASFLGMQSIFFLMHLKRKPDNPPAININSLMIACSLAFAPYLLILGSNSNFYHAPRLFLVGFTFQAVLMVHFSIKSQRASGFDFLVDGVAPAFALIVLLLPSLGLVAVLLVAWGAVTTLVKSDHPSPISREIFIQSPSIIIAPVILILARDFLPSKSGMISRYDLEIVGQIINGVGAACWVAIVNRYRHQLLEIVPGLAAVCLVIFGVSTFSGWTLQGMWTSILALVFFEGGRGIIWLAVSHAQINFTPIKGFSVTMLATLAGLGMLIFGKFMNFSALGYYSLSFLLSLLVFGAVRYFNARATIGQSSD